MILRFMNKIYFELERVCSLFECGWKLSNILISHSMPKQEVCFVVFPFQMNTELFYWVIDDMTIEWKKKDMTTKERVSIRLIPTMKIMCIPFFLFRSRRCDDTIIMKHDDLMPKSKLHCWRLEVLFFNFREIRAT